MLNKTPHNIFDLVVIGGGAAGIFAALAAKKARTQARVTVLEKTAVLLSKVRISGGGRCNVTHACFDPKQLVTYYPRGSKELIAPFHQFQPKDTVEWFESRGVKLKTESDGRMFPITDSSQTIIDCLLQEARSLQVEIALKQKIERIVKEKEYFTIYLKEGEKRLTHHLLLATGSGQEGYALAKQFGHTIQEPLPSLFTFNIPHFPLQTLSGISVDPVEIEIVGAKDLMQKGALLLTHFGLSGPAVIKLSAWGAKVLHSCNYRADVAINWLPHYSEEELFLTLRKVRAQNPQKIVANIPLFPLPKNLWKALLNDKEPFSTFSDKRLRHFASSLHRDIYHIEGKTTHKEEFVTCGGVSLNEVDFKTLQSKVCPGLFFAGEILDVDGVTGGFNFQNAWTTGYIAGTHAC
jgi:predicted Rossmann fold flavoprotein